MLAETTTTGSLGWALVFLLITLYAISYVRHKLICQLLSSDIQSSGWLSFQGLAMRRNRFSLRIDSGSLSFLRSLNAPLMLFSPQQPSPSSPLPQNNENSSSMPASSPTRESTVTVKGKPWVYLNLNGIALRLTLKQSSARSEQRLTARKLGNMEQLLLEIIGLRPAQPRSNWRRFLVALLTATGSILVRLLHRIVSIHCQDCRIELIDGEELEQISSVTVDIKYTGLELRSLVKPSGSDQQQNTQDQSLPWAVIVQLQESAVTSRQSGSLIDSCSRLSIRVQLCSASHSGSSGRNRSMQNNRSFWPQLWFQFDELGCRFDHIMRYVHLMRSKTQANSAASDQNPAANEKEPKPLDRILKLLMGMRFELTVNFTGSKAAFELDQQQRLQLLTNYRSETEQQQQAAEDLDSINGSGYQVHMRRHLRSDSARRESMLWDAGNLLVAGPRFVLNVENARVTIRNVGLGEEAADDNRPPLTLVELEAGKVTTNLLAVPSLIPSIYGRDRLPLFSSERFLVGASISISSLAQWLMSDFPPLDSRQSQPLQLNAHLESDGVDAVFDLPVLRHFVNVIRPLLADENTETAVSELSTLKPPKSIQIKRLCQHFKIAITGEALVRNCRLAVAHYKPIITTTTTTTTSAAQKNNAIFLCANLTQFKGSIDSQQSRLEDSPLWRQVLVVNCLLSAFDVRCLALPEISGSFTSQLLKTLSADSDSSKLKSIFDQQPPILRVTDACWVNNCTLAARDVNSDLMDCFVDSTFTVADFALIILDSISKAQNAELLNDLISKTRRGQQQPNDQQTVALKPSLLNIDIGCQFVCAKASIAATVESDSPPKINNIAQIVFDGIEADIATSVENWQLSESSVSVKLAEITLITADFAALRTANSLISYRQQSECAERNISANQQHFEVKCGTISGNYGLGVHHSLWLGAKQIFSLLPKPRHYKRSGDINRDSKSILKINLSVDELICRVAMPEIAGTSVNDVSAFVVVFINCTRLAVQQSGSCNQLSCDRLALVSDSSGDILAIRELTCSADKTTETAVQLSSSIFQWNLPFDYRFDCLLDSIGCMVKAIKQLQSSGSLLAPSSPQPSPQGRLREELYRSLPAIDVRVKRLCIRFEDDPMERRLAAIFRVGLDEQRHRMDRDRLMRRKLASLKHGVLQRPDQTTPGRLFVVSDKGQTKAWQVLNQANSAIWIRRLRPLLGNQFGDSDSAGRYLHSTLFSVDVDDVFVRLRPPVLSQPDSLERSLCDLDTETPPDLQYDTLLAAQVILEFTGISVRIREMQPIFYVPANYGYRARVSGPVFITEHVQDLQQSSRLIRLALGEGAIHSEFATIFRTVSPTKLYGSLQAEIERSGGVKLSATDLDSFEDLPVFSYGVALEPHLADLNRILGSLTPPSADRSAPLPFWDKIRLLLHGRVELNVLPSAAFRIKINGTRSAHALQNSGLDVVMKNGVRLRFGSFSSTNTTTVGVSANTASSTVDSIILESGLPITILAGEVIFSVPAIDESTVWPDKSSFSVQREMVAKLCGGVALGFEIDYETAGGSHVDVDMKVADFADQFHDAFAGIRSKCLNLNVYLAAPAQKTSLSTTVGNFNFANLNMYLVEHFVQIARLYQSPLTVLPIRRGPIFRQQQQQQQPIKTQKLSRFIKQINCRVHLQSALLGYGHESDRDVEIGFRGRVRDFQMAISLQQENFIAGQKGAEWDVLGSDFDLTDLESRVYHNCASLRPSALSSSNSSLPTGAIPSTPLRTETDNLPSGSEAADRRDWAMPDDLNFGDPNGQQQFRMRFLPFFSAPKLVYFRHGSGSKFEVWDPETGEICIPERDVSMMQLALMQKRVEEIDAEIAKDKERIRQWEDRIAVFFDEQLQRQSKALVEKMALLFERKALIESQIRRRGRSGVRKQPLRPTITILGDQVERLRHLRRGSVAIDSPLLSSPTHRGQHKRRESIFSSATEVSDASNARRDKEFRHHYIIHNLNILWNVELRNAVYKFVDLEQQQSSVGYYLRSSSLRILREILARAVRDGVSSSGHSSGTSSAGSQSSENLNANPNAADKDLAQQLLEQLIADRKSNFVVNVEQTDGKGNNNVALKDPSHPSYVSPNFRQRNQSIFQFFYPQISFEIPAITSTKQQSFAATRSLKSKGGSVIVFAENMNLKQVDIEDNGQLVKTRHTFTVDNGQFFSVFRQHVLRTLLSQGVISRADEMPWPVWVPIENLLRPVEDDAPGKPHDQSDLFSRFVNRATVIVQFDSCSPVYLRTFRKKTGEGLEAARSASATGLGETVIDSSEDLEFVNSVFVRFPKLNIQATSDQYRAIYDIIYHLLAYRDPDRKRRTEHIQTMLLALRKEQDLRQSVAVVEKMQNNIRDYSEALRLNAFAALPQTPRSPVKPTFNDQQQHSSDYERWEEQRRSAALALLLFMEALKTLSFQRKNKDSSRKSFRTVIDANQLSWLLLGETRTPICEITVTNANYYNLSSEDRSKLHTLEIEQIFVINRLPVPYLRETVAPYGTDDREPDYFSRHKMLRVYWRGLPPVAGIPIIEHFEVNIFPLIFQPTYELSKAVIEYLYRKKSASKFLTAEAAALPPIELEQASSRSFSQSSFSHERSASTGATVRRPRSLSANQETSQSSTALAGILSLKRSAELQQGKRVPSIINTSGLQSSSSSEILSRSARPRAASSPLRQSPLATASEDLITPASSMSSTLIQSRRVSREDLTNFILPSASSVSERTMSGSLTTPLSAVSGGTMMTPGAKTPHLNYQQQPSTSPILLSAFPTDRRRKTLWRQMPGSSSSLNLLDLPAEGELKLMKDRASANKTFVYIKVPGVTHCLSYHGEKEKNIEDLYQIVLRVPTLEYRNKTWTWLEFINAIRKDIKMALLAQSGSLIRESLVKRRRLHGTNSQPSNQQRPQSNTSSDAPPTDDDDSSSQRTDRFSVPSSRSVSRPSSRGFN